MAFSAVVCAGAVTCGDGGHGGAPQPHRGPFNLVVINIDTLRADHLGSYGYARPTSPFLDELARQSVVFENAYSASSFTRESVASLLSGRLPTSGSAVGWSAAPSPDTPTLGEILRSAGYRSGFFSNTVMLTNRQFTRGFDEVEHLAQQWGLSRTSPRLTERAGQFLEESSASSQPFALYLHYLDPHGPYDPPEQNYLRFAEEIAPNPVRVYGGLRGRVADLLRAGYGPGSPSFDDLVARYDAEISHTDEAIGKLLEVLEQRGLLDTTVVVLTSDHGEEFLDHDFFEHAWTLHEESIRVPLLVFAPRLWSPKRVRTPVSSVDLLPTLGEALALEVNPRAVDGLSLVPLLTGAPAEATEHLRRRPIFAEMLIRERNVVRAVVQRGWKYLAWSTYLPPAERAKAAAAEEGLREANKDQPIELWPPVVREELYRLSVDPAERQDLAQSNLDQLRHFRRLLESYRAQVHSGAPLGFAPREELSEEERRRLRALGYL